MGLDLEMGWSRMCRVVGQVKQKESHSPEFNSEKSFLFGLTKNPGRTNLGKPLKYSLLG
jgi:hypothetical protein